MLAARRIFCFPGASGGQEKQTNTQPTNTLKNEPSRLSSEGLVGLWWGRGNSGWQVVRHGRTCRVYEVEGVGVHNEKHGLSLRLPDLEC